MLHSPLIILKPLGSHLFLTVKKKKKSECSCSKGNQSQLFIMGAYLKLKALEKIKIKALRETALTIFNVSDITDVDTSMNQSRPLVLFEWSVPRNRERRDCIIMRCSLKCF